MTQTIHKKSVAFLYANNELWEREIKKTITFTLALKRIKYLGINFTKVTQSCWLFVTSRTVVCKAPLSMEFSR